MADLTPDQLESLRQFSSCTISNTVETFNVRPRNKGFMTPNIKCIFPDMGNMIGYAVTAVIQAEAAPSARMNASRIDFIDEILKIPEPRIIVMKDLDYPNVIGSFWGEVQVNIHGAVNCVGTVTDGGVRDLDEMREKGFFAFASDVLVSRSYVHLVELNVPVNVGGVDVNPGDIIMGDKHGVINIPKEVAADIPEAVKGVQAREKVMIDYCRSPNFTVDGLRDQLRKMYGG